MIIYNIVRGVVSSGAATVGLYAIYSAIHNTANPDIPLLQKAVLVSVEAAAAGWFGSVSYLVARGLLPKTQVQNNNTIEDKI